MGFASIASTGLCHQGCIRRECPFMNFYEKAILVTMWIVFPHKFIASTSSRLLLLSSRNPEHRLSTCFLQKASFTIVHKHSANTALHSQSGFWRDYDVVLVRGHYAAAVHGARQNNKLVASTLCHNPFHDTPRCTRAHFLGSC